MEPPKRQPGQPRRLSDRYLMVGLNERFNEARAGELQRASILAHMRPMIGRLALITNLEHGSEPYRRQIAKDLALLISRSFAPDTPLGLAAQASPHRLQHADVVEAFETTESLMSSELGALGFNVYSDGLRAYDIGLGLLPARFAVQETAAHYRLAAEDIGQIVIVSPSFMEEVSPSLENAGLGFVLNGITTSSTRFPYSWQKLDPHAENL